MKKRQGGVSTILTIIIFLLAAFGTVYLATAALARRNTAKGAALLQNEDYAAAAGMFRSAEKYNRYILRKDLSVIEGLAQSSYGLQDFDAALEYYGRLAGARPEDAKARYRLGLIYIEKKDYGEARKQAAELKEIQTFEADLYAEELTKRIHGRTIRGVFENFYDKFFPQRPDDSKSADLWNNRPDKHQNGSGGSEELSPGVEEDGKRGGGSDGI